MVKVIYPGTFDPITCGHVNIIERACSLFDEVVVAIAENKQKKPLFDSQERIELTKIATEHLPQVSVETFSNLLIDFAKQHAAKVIIRGLRAVTDFDFEFQLAGMNRRLSPDIETIFLTPSEEYAFVSSSLVREIALMSGKVGEFVPMHVEAALQKKFGRIEND